MGFSIRSSGEYVCRGGGRLVAQLCLSPCDPLDYSPSGISVHGILLARILEWDDISFSTGEDAHLQKLEESRHTQNSLKVLWKKQIE